MTYYFCIAEGMADCTPTTQDYYACELRGDVIREVRNACDKFDRLEAEAGDDTPFKYAFRMPNPGEDNYSQRVRIGRDRDWVLDIIGMTEADYNREMGDIEDRSACGG